MPSFETMDRHQTAILWEKTGLTHLNEIITAEPIEIKVRWINKPRQVPGPNGTPITVAATAVVARDISIGSLMYLGKIEAYYGVGSAGDTEQIMEVQAAPKTTSIDNRHIRRTVGLNYYKGSLPNAS